jgi:hypothetical protein
MGLGSEIRDPGKSHPRILDLGGSATLDPEFYCEPCWQVDLEVGPSLVFLHGTLIRHFMHVKENIFGEDQRYTPMDQQEQEGGAAPADALEKKKEGAAAGGAVDLRQYRPLNVILDITVHDLQVRWIEIEPDSCLVWTCIRLQSTAKKFIYLILCGYMVVYGCITHYSLDLVTRFCSTLYSQCQYLIYTVQRCTYSGNV